MAAAADGTAVKDAGVDLFAELQRDARAVVIQTRIDDTAPAVDDGIFVCRGVGIDGAVALVSGADDPAVICDENAFAADVHRPAVARDGTCIPQQPGRDAAIDEIDAVEAAVDGTVVVDPRVLAGDLDCRLVG